MRLGAWVVIGGAALLAACGDGSAAASGTGQQASAGGGSAIELVPDTALGAKYGATGPRKCSTRKIAGETPTADEAAKLVTCQSEGMFGENLYVVDQVQVTAIGKPRGYNANEDINVPDIDVTKPLVAIRGGFDQYQCAQLQQPGQDFGKQYDKGSNCNRTHERNASGLCFEDTFGDWTCKMVDADSKTNEDRMVAAP